MIRSVQWRRKVVYSGGAISQQEQISMVKIESYGKLLNEGALAPFPHPFCRLCVYASCCTIATDTMAC